MITGVRIEKQEDNSYEVLFDDGSKVSGCSLEKAIFIAENTLYPITKESEAVNN